ncbi:hypothetical protein [Segatella copri]|uniref:Uncharacterized protein n=1 Tax=Segatella copri TaxID=165179 RepID=A0AAW5UVM2_9BACT|nr:hypothetical protein [Segatella copri]MCW4113060.1 hypothetical protein [Segatella copri]MCW4122802.1 hypothetical protein [Segatella copri]MCW4156573.1 hypothetical protein [Segatella copri]
MKQTICILLSAIAISLGCSAKKQTSTFPDGIPISSWFADTTGVELKDMGKPYIITDYGVVNDSTIIQTQKIQEVIDRMPMVAESSWCLQALILQALSSSNQAATCIWKRTPH